MINITETAFVKHVILKMKKLILSFENTKEYQEELIQQSIELLQMIKPY